MDIETINGRVYNDAGQVAISYFQPLNYTIQIGSKVYTFVVKKNISMAWIDAEDVDLVLATTKVCCGGNRNRIFRLEHETHVRRWLNLIE